MSRVKIKICGITKVEEVPVLNEVLPEYIGTVLFYDKSKRNISCEKAKEILKSLNPMIQKVAVLVSPTVSQIKKVEELGYDIIQIHGEISEEVLKISVLPIWKAYNKKQGEEIQLYKHEKIIGYVMDGAEAGSGKTFAWKQEKREPLDQTSYILAGGLNCENVTEAIHIIRPAVVDVSTGVENVNGKDNDKIREFIRKVRNYG
jgi:phosphoribosylanthranilate isomerase